jgi:hypothetical protein
MLGADFVSSGGKPRFATAGSEDGIVFERGASGSSRSKEATCRHGFAAHVGLDQIEAELGAKT